MGKQRQRRDARAAKPRPMRLTKRDIEIILAVYLFRVLRQDQLEKLFFKSKNTCQRVLARLFHHGFLQRLFWPVVAGTPPTLYVIDKKGMALLTTQLGYDDSHW